MCQLVPSELKNFVSASPSSNAIQVIQKSGKIFLADSKEKYTKNQCRKFRWMYLKEINMNLKIWSSRLRLLKDEAVNGTFIEIQRYTIIPRGPMKRYWQTGWLADWLAWPLENLKCFNDFRRKFSFQFASIQSKSLCILLFSRQVYSGVDLRDDLAYREKLIFI